MGLYELCKSALITLYSDLDVEMLHIIVGRNMCGPSQKRCD